MNEPARISYWDTFWRKFYWLQLNMAAVIGSILMLKILRWFFSAIKYIFKYKLLIRYIFTFSRQFYWCYQINDRLKFLPTIIKYNLCDCFLKKSNSLYVKINILFQLGHIPAIICACSARLTMPNNKYIHKINPFHIQISNIYLLKYKVNIYIYMYV